MAPLASYRDGASITQEMPALTMHELVHGRKEERPMAKRTLTEEQKAKMAAGRAAAAAAGNGGAGTKRANLDEQLAAVKARSEAGDSDAQALMPALDSYVERMHDAKAAAKAAARRVRRLLSTLKD